MIIRCDSAAMVPNTRELLPDPDTPVNTVSRRLGSSRLTSFRLFSRAPCTRMTSWLSAGFITRGSCHVVGRLRSPTYLDSRNHGSNRLVPPRPIRTVFRDGVTTSIPGAVGSSWMLAGACVGTS